MKIREKCGELKLYLPIRQRLEEKNKKLTIIV